MFRSNPEKLLRKSKNRYELVLLTSRRARELTEGAKPLVKVNGENSIDIALGEIAAGKIWEKRDCLRASGSSS